MDQQKPEEKNPLIRTCSRELSEAHPATVSSPAYIVLDIPSPMAEKIQDYRRKFDAERAALPVEITVTGSSGVGTISPGQNWNEVFALVDKVAASISPFESEFYKVERFENTNIFYLTFRNPSKYENVHKKLANSGVKFDPSPFPYKPHCTIKLVSVPDDNELLELFFMEIPRSRFVIDTLSIYSFDPKELRCELLHKAELGKPRSPAV